MRVAFVAWNGSPHTRRWASFFAERGHEVRVVTCGDDDEPSPYDVVDLGAPRLGKTGYVAKIPGARRAIRSFEPDVVHAHFVTSYGLLGLTSGRKPLVVTGHGSDLLTSPRNPFMRVVVKRVLRASSLVTVPSTEMQEVARRLAAPQRPPISVFQYGVEVDRLVEVGDREHAGRKPDGELRIVSVRFLEPLYRIDLLLHALHVLADRGVSFTCDLAGGGSQRPALEALAAELELSGRVTFHGNLPPDDVERLVGAADVYVSVAGTDGMSISLLEALALGTIPVLSDIAANRPWIKDGISGLLSGDTPQQLADALQRASTLDRGVAVSVNRATVAARADRSAALGALETQLEALVNR
jgi:glycosyltransferase involved in cell wall biosynthesis